MVRNNFNLNLLSYNSNKRITQFIDELCIHSFIPHINLPTRIKNQSKTLSDNIFYNKLNPEATAGNIATSVLDHLMQFLIEPSPFASNSEETTKTWRCHKNFDKEQLRDDLFKTDLEQALELNKNDINTSINLFPNVINITLNNHVPIKIKPKTNANHAYCQTMDHPCNYKIC